MISIIAVVGQNNELGKNNKLIWDIPGDLKYFKTVTTGHKVVMGLNTYYSIGRPLPNRKNIVIADKKVSLPSEVTVYYDMEELIKNEISDDEEVFIIGGASVYNYFYKKADKFYITIVNKKCPDADVYFPKMDLSDWYRTLINRITENKIVYDHVTFERKVHDID